MGTMTGPTADWQEQLTRFLIEGGLQGRKQSEITRRMQGKCSAPIFTEWLYQLAKQDKVQRFVFTPPGTTRSVTVWRATQKIYDEDE